MDIVRAITAEQIRTDLPEVLIGDTVKVYIKIKEGSKERIQMFEGTVIAKKRGGIQETFKVRRVSYGVGVERTFPINSPKVAAVTVVRKGVVRRAKIGSYLRKSVKQPKIKERN